uniref:Uncharacterized protein n=1 Tax=Oryctolagus cuniculus TaxID=9986 RepID=A0A5F9DPI5_RABIT
MVISKLTKDMQMRAAINRKVGERECCKALPRAKLVKCAWRDPLQAHWRGNFKMLDSLQKYVAKNMYKILRQNRS